MENDLYTSIVGHNEAYWLGIYRNANDDSITWRNGKGEEITNYGITGDLDKITPWNKPSTGVLHIPDNYKVAIGKNSEWFAVAKQDTNGNDTRAMTICTYVCRNYRKFP